MDHRYLVREIILKYHRGEPLTEEEQAILDVEMADLPADRVWERVRAHVERQEGRVVRMRPWYIRWPAVTAGAAAVVILIAGGLYRYRAHPDRTLAVQPVWQTVAPGHFHAELSGPDGVVVIDSVGGHQSDPYRVSLPDGSTVNLSYVSSIRYPKGFVKRKVFLSGQALFDVVKNEHPFEVGSGNTTVQVLGTKFNWMHYPGVPEQITLLTGKIQLLRGKFKRVLAPGERAVIQEGNPAPVQVEQMKRPEESVAWMGARPEVVFDRTDLYTVIQRMAQYYQLGFFVDSSLRTGRLVNVSMNLQWSLEENLTPIRNLLKDDAQVNVTNGLIEVRLK